MSSSLIIGVSGGSGSGKTTFATTLREQIGPEFCSILLQDSYYFDQSRLFKGDGSINYDHPNSIDFSLMALHLSLLRQGESVKVPRYCFKTHKRLREFTELAPKSVIITDGILVLSQPRLREYTDLNIFIDTPEDVRFSRRLKRDVVERGRTKEGVRKQIAATVKPMHDQFVEPSMRFADLTYSGTEDFIPKVIELMQQLEVKKN